jgi:hypothetical protein
MGQAPEEDDQLVVPPARQVEASAGTGTDVMLAEYSALHAEIDRRANVQWNVFALQIGSAGVISSLAISSASHIALLLLIPLSSNMLGSRYILHDYHIKLITVYIKDSLSARLGSNLKFESWKAERTHTGAQQGRWFTVTGWNVLHPTRIAFEGVALLALPAAGAAAAYDWAQKTPEWYLILGFAILWGLGVAATYRLHILFNQSSKQNYAADRHVTSDHAW